MSASQFRWIIFDWGDTLMYEDGPQDLPMALWPKVKMVPGARATLSKLAKRHQLAIATNASVSNRRMIELALQRGKLRGYISEIFCYREIGHKKDTMEFWNAVMTRLKVSATEIAMVGDSLEHDIIPATRFGIYAVWFNENNRQANPPAGVIAISRLMDLLPLIAGK